MAADLLITHLQEKLSEIREDLHVILQGKKNSSHQSEVTLNSLVTGALEASFCALDEQIEQEKNTYCISGGSTAIVALFLLDRVFIANAGDCRAVLYLGDKIISLSKEHSPINELGRLQTTAYFHPELLCGEFSCCMFVRRLMKNDMGKQVLCKEPLKKGWVYREVTTDDIKFPLVQSNGIKTRLMGTIGVARGFGDHDLTTFENVPIKPFLIPNPDVEVYQLEDVTLSEDDVLIMACDGLWDVMSNETAIEIVRKVLEHTSKDDHKRYTMAATELVQFARGKLTNQGWKMPNGEEGSFDDICVFVIPVHNIVTKLSTKL